VRLENDLPAALPAGRPTALFCYGHCFHRSRQVSSLTLLAGAIACRPTAARMPRRDLFEWLGHTDEDPLGHSYRSGFWATLSLPPQPRPGSLLIQAAARLDDGAELLASLGRIEIVAGDGPSARRRLHAPGTIAVCMATFEPELVLFRKQIDSLRAQTDTRWTCVISDGGSSLERFRQIEEVVGDDRRFVVSRSERRLDPYRNFERSLALAPLDAQTLALCDQDDCWYPDKLATLRAALGSAQLVYCDQRLVGADGRLLRNSLWVGRRNDHRNLASLLVANAIPGAAMLLRREVAELALPFPDAPGVQYHDHWLALVALARGEVSYVDRPLYDYVQHSGAVSADVFAPAPRASRLTRRHFAIGSRGWRAAYFGGYLTREVQAQTLLLRCGRWLTPRKRRALEWFVSADRSLPAFAWIALRPLRRLAGRDETLGGEAALASGLLWRRLIVLAVGASPPRRRSWCDASFPDPPRFEQRRLRRWRAGR
jgi:hypothetical protein